MAILTTLLLMAVYTAFAVARIQSEPTSASQLGVVLPGRAEALAARLLESSVSVVQLPDRWIASSTVPRCVFGCF